MASPRLSSSASHREKDALQVLRKYCRKVEKHSAAAESHTATDPQSLLHVRRRTFCTTTTTQDPSEHANESSDICTQQARRDSERRTLSSIGAHRRAFLRRIEHSQSFDTEDQILDFLSQETDRDTPPNLLSRIGRAARITYKRFALKYILLVWALVAYALAGGLLFYLLESPAEEQRSLETAKRTLILYRNYTRLLTAIFGSSADCNAIFDDDSSRSPPDVKCVRLLQFFRDYDNSISKLSPSTAQWTWSYWNAVFYAGTIFTTIGYGNLACKTDGGRLATIIYAVFGIPLMLFVLNALGKVLFLSVQTMWDRLHSSIYRPLHSNASESVLQKCTESDNGNVDVEEEDPFKTFPMSLALSIVFVYICICAFLFSFWENWDYFTAFYFFFISLSTVGLGDEVPEYPQYACASFIFFVIGLSLVSMCLTIMQMRVEARYMAAIQMIDEAYLVQHEEKLTTEETMNASSKLQTERQILVEQALQQNWRRLTSTVVVPSLVYDVLQTRTTIHKMERHAKQTVTNPEAARLACPTVPQRLLHMQNVEEQSKSSSQQRLQIPGDLLHVEHRQPFTTTPALPIKSTAIESGQESTADEHPKNDGNDIRIALGEFLLTQTAISQPISAN